VASFNDMKQKIKFITLPLLEQQVILAEVVKGKNFVDLLNDKKNKKYSKWLKARCSSGFEMEDGTLAQVVSTQEDRPVAIIFRGSADDMTIMHEVHHLIEKASTYNAFTEELEFKANLMTSLFSMIKRELYDR